jgi:hypothetical protein
MAGSEGRVGAQATVVITSEKPLTEEIAQTAEFAEKTTLYLARLNFSASSCLSRRSLRLKALLYGAQHSPVSASDDGKRREMNPDCTLLATI